MLLELERSLAAAGIRHAIAGGIAMAAHGRVRATEDIDILVDARQANELGAVMRSLAYAEQPHGVATRWARKPVPELPGIVEWIDALPARREAGLALITRANQHRLQWEGVALPIVDPAGIVLMKCIALAADPARAHDRDDVRFLLQEHAARIDRATLLHDAAALGQDVVAALESVAATRIADAVARPEDRL